MAAVSLSGVLLTELTAELALFAAAGYFFFAIDDLLVDLIYFARRSWRALVVYSRFPKAFAETLEPAGRPGWMAVLIPAWDEASVIAPMLRNTLQQFGDQKYRLFVGHYRNDPATAAAIATISDPRITAVPIDCDGPTIRLIASTGSIDS